MGQGGQIRAHMGGKFVHLRLTFGGVVSKIYAVWCTLGQYGAYAFHDNRRNAGVA